MRQPRSTKILSYDDKVYLCSSVDRNAGKWLRCCNKWCTACEKLAFSPSLAKGINGLLGNAMQGDPIDHLFQRRITVLRGMYGFNKHLIPYVTQALEAIRPNSNAWTDLSKDGAGRSGIAPEAIIPSSGTLSKAEQRHGGRPVISPPMSMEKCKCSGFPQFKTF
jgi:hypothetical protein